MKMTAVELGDNYLRVLLPGHSAGSARIYLMGATRIR
jgi:hypothetical protein